mmetsp:Transcript_5092/g.6907  ORF Transcript_5092/g.6907 Transcript_5092/m.6907 type:complete len:80 (+) Transcript_5092:196-435(+)
MKQSDEMTKKTNDEEARNREGRSEQEGEVGKRKDDEQLVRQWARHLFLYPKNSDPKEVEKWTKEATIISEKFKNSRDQA